MNMFRHIAKPVSYAVIAGVLALGIHLPAADAALVGTEVAIHAAQAQHERERIQGLLERVDVREKLVALGVEPAQVQARVDALTDEEIGKLAKRLDTLPAGGDSGFSAVLDVALIVFLILLITDLLGVTDVFPFTKKGAARAK